MNRLFPLMLAALALATPASAQISAFQHVIIVIQENRTPDNLFQGLCPPTDPSACSIHPSSQQYNIQTTGWLDKTSKTGTTNPRPVPFGVEFDLTHIHSAFVRQCDMNGAGVCAMDGAAYVGCTKRSIGCPKKAAFTYVDNSTGSVQPYIDIARAYGWGNYMFQTNQGPSFPAHQYLFGATSAPTGRDDHNGIFASGNTPIHDVHNGGCASATTAKVPLINPEGVEFGETFPCFNRRTLADLLDAQKVSWRYYGVILLDGGIWMAPNAIKHICVAVDQNCTGNQWTKGVDPNPLDVLSDISTNCKLRGVSWVTPDAQDGDHMGRVTNTGGPSWVASIINAVGNSKCTNPDGSSYWSTTAIIVTWDDWGGCYDHERPFVEPYPQGGYQLGFRVPLLVVSAYTPRGFISNFREDFGSVVRFVERNFGIMEGALTFADARADSDLREFFSLGNPPRQFQPINAPLSAKYFLSAKPSGLPVDDD